MYPRLRPPQRGQTKPLGQRCAVRWAAHWVSSPKRARNWLTVRMGFPFRLKRFISDIISPFVSLTELDIHLNLLTICAPASQGDNKSPTKNQQLTDRRLCP